MSSDCTICYVCDIGFLLPSMISATSVRKFISRSKAEIVIFTIGVDCDKVSSARSALAPLGIDIVPMDDRLMEGLDRDRLAGTKTPISTFGRFFMGDLLPRSCRRIVYLDGDVLCILDPAALIDAEVPEGKIAAVDDTISYRQALGFGGTTKEIRHYWSQLGLSRQDSYFNAGVFAVSRTTWDQVAPEAYNFFLNNVDKCRHYDQSALNAVLGSRRLRLSAKWNFQTQMKFWNADRYVQPHLCHFTRYPKPWMGACEPWVEMFPVYQSARCAFASLGLPLTMLSNEELKPFRIQAERSYAYLQLPLASHLALGAMRFQSLEKRAWI